MYVVWWIVFSVCCMVDYVLCMLYGGLCAVYVVWWIVFSVCSINTYRAWGMLRCLTLSFW